MPNTHKCAHPSCQCQIDVSQKYCSEICKDAGSKEIEIGCECEHPACLELEQG